MGVQRKKKKRKKEKAYVRKKGVKYTVGRVSIEGKCFKTYLLFFFRVHGYYGTSNRVGGMLKKKSNGSYVWGPVLRVKGQQANEEALRP